MATALSARRPTFLVQADGNSILNVTLADVNNDHNLDVVATLTVTGGFAFGVMFGDGKGDFTFNPNTLVPVALTNSYTNPDTSATLADFNRDGKLDLLVPSTDSQGNFSLTDYLGKGNGTFTPGPIIYTARALQIPASLSATSTVTASWTLSPIPIESEISMRNRLERPMSSWATATAVFDPRPTSISPSALTAWELPILARRFRWRR